MRRSTYPAKVFRGSRRRVRAIRVRGNGSPALWCFLLWIAVVLLVIVPRVLESPPGDQLSSSVSRDRTAHVSAGAR